MRSDEILSRSSPDLMDSTKYWLDLDRSSEISAPITKPETDGHELETKLTGIERPDHYYWSVWVFFFSPTQKIRGGFKLGTNLTQPNPWTPLVIRGFKFILGVFYFFGIVNEYCRLICDGYYLVVFNTCKYYIS